jgi:hypothetical protein
MPTVVAPASLLIQAERLGVNKTTLKYFAAVASGAIGGADTCPRRGKKLA